MLEVIEAGLYSTVQDEGRTDWGHLGVRQAGAADPLALAAANLLAGAPADAPAVEMTLLGATFAVRDDVLVGLAGADMEALVPEEDRRLAPGGSYRLRAGTTLAFGTAADGARTYLALAGGVDVPRVLGSASTDPIAGFGGIDGRPLRAGDRLGAASDPVAEERRWPAGEACSGVAAAGEPVELAVVKGPHLDLLPAGFDDAIAGRTWTVTQHADRAGLRLEGEALAQAAAVDLVSQPMLPGAVQVPPSGQPIVLMPDAPTVGGYPVPAVVASSSMPQAGQLRPGDRVRFVWIDLDEARRRTQAQAGRLASMAAALA